MATVAEKQSGKFQPESVGTAEAFYVIFRSLPEKDRMAVARYILEDDDIRHCYELSEIPNEATLKAFAENKSAMPLFHSVEELRKDLLV
ncbi:hypothetical protein QUF80_04140 [Desulfococcaceae bacterium HSG8]|nr:hypothetical protein [Desulfococcaceae bacterium HSG8]